MGLLASSPVFAEASKHVNAFRLIALGLAVWTLATAGCGLATGGALQQGPSTACYVALMDACTREACAGERQHPLTVSYGHVSVEGCLSVLV